MIYTTNDIAIIIPTKDRPTQLNNLLNSLVLQKVSYGRVIIVDGGQSVEAVVLEYKNKLPIEYYNCNPPGQIRQKNLGLSKLNPKYPLICFFDDDIVLEQNAFENIINYWNQVDVNTAGICFNIINEVPPPFSWFGRLIYFSSSIPGKVLASGRNTSLANINKNIKSEWLGGGYTIWKHDILKKYTQNNLNTHWAIAEDLRFSYPIGKHYPLFVCANAKIRHEHTYDQYIPNKVHKIRGFKESLACIYFVNQHKELKIIACMWMLITTSIIRFIIGTISWNSRHLGYSLGQLKAQWVWMKSMLGFSNIKQELSDW